jgi:general secretion pathway protein D
VGVFIQAESVGGRSLRLRTAFSALLWLAIATPTLAQPADKPKTATPSPPERAESYTFAFRDADISQVTSEILGRALGLTFSVDPGVTGKMSFQIDKKLTGAQLLEAFEVVLEENDVSLVREGDTLIVKPRDKARQSARVRTLNDGIRVAGYQTLAVPVDFAQPSEISKALQAVAGKDIVIFEDDKLGLLILGGTQSELESAVETVHLFDTANFQDARIRFFDLQQAAAPNLASDLNKLIETSKVSGVTAVPLKRLNALFIVTQSAGSMAKVADWIRKLDVPSREKTLSLWIYHPRNLSAQSLSEALNGVIGGGGSGGGGGAAGPALTSPAGGGLRAPSAGGPGGSLSAPAASQPIGGGTLLPTGGGMVANGGSVPATTVSSEDDPVRIGVDQQSNTLIVSASQSHWVQIQRTLDELDRTPGQVLIEASILEVSLSNQFNTGVDWSVLTDKGRLGASNINSPTGLVAQAVPGLSVTFLQKDIQAAINALSARTSVEVISAPKLVALDNHQAKLSVGDDVPVTTQSEQSTVGTGSPILNSVSYRSTGVILTVTPRIGGDGRVTLDISQEVSTVARTTSSNIDSPTIQERKVATTLVIGNGGVVALGGLISSNRNTASSGIPYLEAIPGAGRLFKTETKSSDRTELIVLISAKIIPDNTAADKATAALLADMQDIKSHGLLEH